MSLEKVVIHLRVPRYVLDGMELEKDLEGFSYPCESARRILCRYYKSFLKKNSEILSEATSYIRDPD